MLTCAPRNVASYSLMTLAVHDWGMGTLIKLFETAVDAKQQITLATYNCIVRRLEKIGRWKITMGQKSMMHVIWDQSIPLLKDRRTDKGTRDNWYRLVIRVCDRLCLSSLKSMIREHKKAFCRQD